VKNKKPTYIIGLDLAQADDRSILMIAESVPAMDERGVPAPELHIKYLHRFPVNVSYLDQASKVVEIRGSIRDLQSAPFVVDASGVGRAVVDLFRNRGANPIPVTITGGNSSNYDQSTRYWKVAKRLLVDSLQILLQNDRLKIPSDLPHLKVLLRELRAFKIKVSDSGNVTYSARAGEHDDTISALSLAAWYASRISGGFGPGGRISMRSPKRFERPRGGRKFWRSEAPIRGRWK
jgi:hypothetical protein